MKYFLTFILTLIFGLALTQQVSAQDDNIQDYLGAYEQALISGNRMSAADYALVLSEQDFSQAPLSSLDVRNLKTELTEALVAGNRQSAAMSLLARLVREDERHLAVETDPVLKSEIRQDMIDRLIKLADLYEHAGASGRALHIYRRAHLEHHEFSKFTPGGSGAGGISLGSDDPEIQALQAAWGDVKRQYTGSYIAVGNDNTFPISVKIVKLINDQLEADQESGNINASIQSLSLMRFYITYQCGNTYSDCTKSLDQAASISVESVDKDLASEWMAFAIPDSSFRRSVCALSETDTAPFAVQSRSRYAARLAQLWENTGDIHAAATQDYEALNAAQRSLGWRVPDNDPVRICLNRLKTLVMEAAEQKQVPLRPDMYMTTASTSMVSEEPFETLRVFYGTNRALDNPDKPDKTFGRKRGDMSYGWIDVTVPKDRAVGEVPRPRFWNFGGAKDGVHIVLSRVNRTDDVTEFSSEFADSVSQSERPEKEAFVFIHGHGVSFAESARRTAQLAVDLDIRNGGAFFSWPTGGVATGYTVSESNARWAEDDLKSFLTMIATESGADKIHLIAHSMGNRILFEVLRNLDTTSAPMFDQIIWASPDIDAETFGRRVSEISNHASGMTLYASRHDRALKLSQWLHGEYPRAGQAPPLPEVTNASEVVTAVDTSEVARRSKDFIAHADYAGGAITDLRSIVWLSLAPDARKCTVIKTETAPYWKAASRSDCPGTEYGLALGEVRLNGLTGARQAVQNRINSFRAVNDTENVQIWQGVAQILESPQFVWQ